MTVQAWTPPAGMSVTVASGWRSFYRAAFLNYGVTPEFYRALYLAQMGRCYICRTARGKHPDDPKGTGGRRLGIDHNHVIGPRIEAVRGLLCTGSLSANTCNRLIAHYKPAQLQRAVDYMQDPPATDVLRGLQDNPHASDDQIMSWGRILT